MTFLKEFWAFLRSSKKYWLLPILVTMLVLGALQLGLLLVRRIDDGTSRRVDPQGKFLCGGERVAEDLGQEVDHVVECVLLVVEDHYIVRRLAPGLRLGSGAGAGGGPGGDDGLGHGGFAVVGIAHGNDSRIESRLKLGPDPE